MESKEHNPISVESLLEEARFSPAPSFTNGLHDRLSARLSAAEQTLLAGDPDRRNGSRPQAARPGWLLRPALAALAALAVLILLGGLVGFVPAVRAQVADVLRHFGVPLPAGFGDGGGLVISPFTPLAPTDVPADIDNFASLNLNTGQGKYIELRYFNAEKFIVIYETPTAEGMTFPEGQAVQFGGHDGILTRMPAGMVMLAAPGPQPWRQSGNGGGGGGGGGGAQDAPPVMNFEQAVQVTWVQDGLWIELLTNLPEEEAVRLVGTLAPAPQLLEK
jgi:hypothetical protein